MRLGVWCVLLAACGGDDAPAKPGGAAPVEPAATAVHDVADHMRDHFTRIGAIRDALIVGDLAATRAPAKWLAEHAAPEHFPARWLPHVADLQLLASDLVRETDLAKATATSVALARACGACHEALETKLVVQVPPLPAADGDHKVYMQRHKWAADRMWQGLVEPSNDAWQAGVTALADSPVHFKDLSRYGDRAGAIIDLGNGVRVLAAAGKDATEPPAQAAVMTQFLTTCATCHALVGRK